MTWPRQASAAVLALAGMFLLSPWARADTAGVEILDFGYFGEDVVVAVGDQVNWVNSGAAPHTVTADDGVVNRFNSGKLQSGVAYIRTFPAVGTFAYHCTLYPSMRGTVHVTEHRTAPLKYRIPMLPRAGTSSPASSTSQQSLVAGSSHANPNTQSGPRRLSVAVPANSATQTPPSPRPGSLPAPTNLAAPPAEVPSPSGAAEESLAPQVPNPDSDGAVNLRQPDKSADATLGKIFIAAGGLLLLANLRRRRPA